MNSPVVRLSLSGSRTFPNLLLRRSQIGRISLIAGVSFMLSLVTLMIDISPLRQSLIMINLGTLAIIVAGICCFIIMRERTQAVATGVKEHEIDQIKSPYPLLFIAPAATVMLLAIHRMISG